MLLNDIGSAHTTTLKKINQHLESNYGFKITEDSKDKDLVVIMETIQDEINDLKIKGDDARSSPEISKRLLVLEGLKTLREFAILQFQSPKLEPLISVLSNKLVAEFSKSGRSMSDFESELRTIMNAYRSSEFRFDDNFIEQRVKDAALAQLQSNDEIDDIAATTLAGPEQTLGEEITDEANVAAQHARAGENEWARDLSNSSAQQTKAKPESDVPMIRDKHGRMVPDPFAAHAAARKKGIAMKENTNLVKHLRQLLETEVSQAEVMMAAKGFAQELQEMVEKIGRLQNEDLPPVTDQMRETYGMESASAFQTQIYGALQSVMDALYTAKGQVDDAVGNMASTGQVTASVDMDKDVDGMDDMDGMGDDMSAMDGSDDAAELDLDNIGDDLGADDEFGSAEDEEPLGRSMKESAILRKKIAEMKKIVNKARKLRESSK